MKKLTKKHRITAALAAVVFCLCVFASCGDGETGYFCIQNTTDEEITVSVDYLGDAYNIDSVRNLTGKSVHSQTIPANSAIEFVIHDGGYYRVYASPGGVKYACWYAGWNILVIF